MDGMEEVAHLPTGEAAGAPIGSRNRPVAVPGRARVVELRMWWCLSTSRSLSRALSLVLSGPGSSGLPLPCKQIQS